MSWQRIYTDPNNERKIILKGVGERINNNNNNKKKGC